VGTVGCEAEGGKSRGKRHADQLHGDGRVEAFGIHWNEVYRLAATIVARS
jgi:hypothetical protein